jgi:hypothetical protein
MSWAQLRELAADPLVTIASQSAVTGALVGHDEKTLAGLLDEAARRLEAELGRRPDLFAYPDGVMSSALFGVLKARSYRAAFGRHSGPVSAFDPPLALPRFPFNVNFGDVARLRMAAGSLPIPAIDRIPADPLLPAGRVAGVNPPAFGFTLAVKGFPTEGLACYASDIDYALELWRPTAERVEVIFKDAFKSGSTRVNCTMPAGDDRWRWFGTHFYTMGGFAPAGNQTDQTARTSSTSGM